LDRKDILVTDPASLLKPYAQLVIEQGLVGKDQNTHKKVKINKQKNAISCNYGIKLL